MPGIRGVSLDATGTLFHVAGSVGLQYARVCASAALRADPDALDAVFPACYAAAARRWPNFGHNSVDVPSAETWWGHVFLNTLDAAGVAARVDMPPAEQAALGVEAYQRFTDPSAWTVFPEVHLVLQRLRARGLAVGVLSNFDPRLTNLLDDLGLAQYLDTVVPCYLIGAEKPSVAAFETVTRNMGLRQADAPHVLHVGDSMKRDVDGAQGAGMAALLLDRTAPSHNLGPRDGPGIISDLTGILTYLDLQGLGEQADNHHG